MTTPTKQQAADSRACLLNLADRRVKHQEAFRQLFGVDLREYWDNFTGFDVIKFDEQLVKPQSNQSTAMAVRERWGQEAVDLCLALINGTERS